PETREYMVRFWIGGFPPLEWPQALSLSWLWARLTALVGAARPGDQASMGYPMPGAYLTLAAAGCVVLWRQNRRASAIVTAPVVVTAAAGIREAIPVQR